MVVTLQPSYILSKEGEVPKGTMPVDFVPPLKELIGSLIENLCLHLIGWNISRD